LRHCINGIGQFEIIRRGHAYSSREFLDGIQLFAHHKHSGISRVTVHGRTGREQQSGTIGCRFVEDEPASAVMREPQRLQRNNKASAEFGDGGAVFFGVCARCRKNRNSPETARSQVREVPERFGSFDRFEYLRGYFRRHGDMPSLGRHFAGVLAVRSWRCAVAPVQVSTEDQRSKPLV
jgi:hypothetical protein